MLPLEAVLGLNVRDETGEDSRVIEGLEMDVSDLLALKLAGPEKSVLNDADISFHETEYERLRRELQSAHDASKLPELPSEETRAALNDLLVRVRLKQFQ